MRLMTARNTCTADVCASAHSMRSTHVRLAHRTTACAACEGPNGSKAHVHAENLPWRGSSALETDSQEVP
jgi:hypothetical protein